MEVGRDKFDYNFNGCLVLVVEDNMISFKLIEAMLSRVNFRIIHARDGQSAINFCRDQKEIRIVLMDIQLPIVNGFDATRAILDFRPDLPIIATTANAFNEDRMDCLSAGCIDYVTKPIDFNKLFALIQSHLN